MRLSQALILLLVAAFSFPAHGSTRVLIGLAGEPLSAEARETFASELVAPTGQVIHQYEFINVVLAEVPEGALPLLAASPHVRFIERDAAVAAPEPLDAQELKLTWEWLPWGIDRIDAEVVHHPPQSLLASLFLLPFLGLAWRRARLRQVLLASLTLVGLALLLTSCDFINIRIQPDTRGFEGEDVKVALLDSGIDPDHPDLRENYRGGYDFVNNDAQPWDDNGHGTQVAGVVAARENGFGIVGVAPQAELFAAKILGSDARGAISDVIRGVEWAIQQGMQVVNMSLGTPEDSQSLHEVLHAAWEAGLVLVAAAGNESGSVLYPAAYAEVLAVSATTKDDRLAGPSNFGPEIDLAAPGEDLPTTYPGDHYRLASGTSFAAAHVTGAAALLISSGISDNHEVRARLEGTAEDIGLPQQKEGSGLVDAAHAVLGEAVGDD